MSEDQEQAGVVVPKETTEPGADVLSRQQRRMIERARQKAERPVEELPFPMRVRMVEREVKSVKSDVHAVVSLLLAGGVFEVVPGTTNIRMRRPWWKRLLRRS